VQEEVLGPIARQSNLLGLIVTITIAVDTVAGGKEGVFTCCY
jgi:hypothetical protein